jgi:hypothetical protein
VNQKYSHSTITEPKKQNTMMKHFRKRTQYANYTTDDISNIKPNDYEIMIRLENILFRAWKILDDVNQTLYHENTKTILKNKPVFDTQKKNLILLSSYKEKVIKNGLIDQKNIEIFQFDELFFDNSTAFIEWNTIATELNSVCGKIYNVLKRNHTINIILNDNDMEKEKVVYRKNKPKRKKFGILLFLVLFSVLLWYNFDLIKATIM